MSVFSTIPENKKKDIAKASVLNFCTKLDILKISKKDAKTLLKELCYIAEDNDFDDTMLNIMLEKI